MPCKTDLGKTEIRSPINGIVLVRSVEPGQTVAASLQAPMLFTLAEDLKKMELHVAVDEADVGSVEVGQKATFTVDAFPNRQFQRDDHAGALRVEQHAEEREQRLQPSSGGSSATSTGVVTYETVLEVDNSDLLLRPGMTATAEIVTTNIEDAVAGAERRAALHAGRRRSARRAERASRRAARCRRSCRRCRAAASAASNAAARRMGRVWVLEDGKPALVMFRPGATDGRMTQVLERGPMPTGGRMGAMANDEKFKQALERKLEPGMKVIVDEEAPKQ